VGLEKVVVGGKKEGQLNSLGKENFVTTIGRTGLAASQTQCMGKTTLSRQKEGRSSEMIQGVR